MAQQRKQQQQLLREVQLPELLARALFLYRKRCRLGKTSRRITLLLNPSEVPPEDGRYDTFMGEVEVKSIFKEGKWITTVKLPPQEGFKLGDHCSIPSRPSPSQPKWREHVPTPEEIKEVQRILGILEE